MSKGKGSSSSSSSNNNNNNNNNNNDDDDDLSDDGDNLSDDSFEKSTPVNIVLPKEQKQALGFLLSNLKKFRLRSVLHSDLSARGTGILTSGPSLFFKAASHISDVTTLASVLGHSESRNEFLNNPKVIEQILGSYQLFAFLEYKDNTNFIAKALRKKTGFKEELFSDGIIPSIKEILQELSRQDNKNSIAELSPSIANLVKVLFPPLTKEEKALKKKEKEEEKALKKKDKNYKKPPKAEIQLSEEEKKALAEQQRKRRLEIVEALIPVLSNPVCCRAIVRITSFSTPSYLSKIIEHLDLQKVGLEKLGLTPELMKELTPFLHDMIRGVFQEPANAEMFLETAKLALQSPRDTNKLLDNIGKILAIPAINEMMQDSAKRSSLVKVMQVVIEKIGAKKLGLEKLGINDELLKKLLPALPQIMTAIFKDPKNVKILIETVKLALANPRDMNKIMGNVEAILKIPEISALMADQSIRGPLVEAMVNVAKSKPKIAKKLEDKKVNLDNIHGICNAALGSLSDPKQVENLKNLALGHKAGDGLNAPATMAGRLESLMNFMQQDPKLRQTLFEKPENAEIITEILKPILLNAAAPNKPPSKNEILTKEELAAREKEIIEKREKFGPAISLFTPLLLNFANQCIAADVSAPAHSVASSSSKSSYALKTEAQAKAEKIKQELVKSGVITEGQELTGSVRGVTDDLKKIGALLDESAKYPILNAKKIKALEAELKNPANEFKDDKRKALLGQIDRLKEQDAPNKQEKKAINKEIMIRALDMLQRPGMEKFFNEEMPQYLNQHKTELTDVIKGFVEGTALDGQQEALANILCNQDNFPKLIKAAQEFKKGNKMTAIFLAVKGLGTEGVGKLLYEVMVDKVAGDKEEVNVGSRSRSESSSSKGSNKSGELPNNSVTSSGVEDDVGNKKTSFFGGVGDSAARAAGNFMNVFKKPTTPLSASTGASSAVQTTTGQRAADLSEGGSGFFDNSRENSPAPQTSTIPAHVKRAAEQAGDKAIAEVGARLASDSPRPKGKEKSDGRVM